MNKSLSAITALVGVCLAVFTTGPIAAEEISERQKHVLWADVELQISRLRGELGWSRLSPQVKSALLAVPRHRFVPNEQRRKAYLNRLLPIGFGQTISQPLIVAIMTELLQVEPGDKIFELGTGSGYQAAVLDALETQVFSVEIVAPLGERARETLDALGHGAVETKIGDGYFGWEAEAPFDAIIVTAAASHIPPPLIRQLKPGGRMVIPVGSRYQTQKLVLLTKSEDGKVRTRELMTVSFVPVTGQR